MPSSKPSKDYSDKSGLAYYWLEENIGRVLVIVTFACLGVWGLLLEGRTDLDPFQQIIRGIGPELAGIVIVAVTIDAMNDRRRAQDLKAQLIRQLGSPHNEVADAAARELRHHGWLFDGSLRKADLVRANLSGSDLSYADLHQANMRAAHLNGTNLLYANLAGADLTAAKLIDARLDMANFKAARLASARLDAASLSGACLNSALLIKSNLVGASLRGAKLISANLHWCNLANTRVYNADFSDADLRMAVLTGSDITFDQLAQAFSLLGTTMPDGVQLGSDESGIEGILAGPTFDEWKLTVGTNPAPR